MKEGTVIKSTGSWYQVQFKDGSQQRCRIMGKFRLQGMKLTNPVGVGDKVMVIGTDDQDVGTIKKIMPRQNYVVRQSPRQKHNLHLLASNIDQAVLILTIIEPNLKQGFIDRFLMMTEPHDIPVTIVFNKSDLFEEEEEEIFEVMQMIYDAIGYQVLQVSAITGEGTEQLKEILKDKISLVGGQSGVGKSTLINHIQPQLDLRTSEISDYSGKGMHTTTFAEMFELNFGGFIIDTPGIKMLTFNNLEVMDVAHNFRELFVESANCRFGNCTHRDEPHCAIKDAVEKGMISHLRYNNYLQIVEEIEDQNYWERNTEL